MQSLKGVCVYKMQSKYSFKEEIYEYIGDINSRIFYAMAGITYPDPTYEIETGRFSAYSIEYVYEGNGVVQQDGAIHKINAGDFFIIHPGNVHYFTNPKNPWKKIWIHISEDVKYIQALMEIFGIENKFLRIPNLRKPLELENILEIIKRNDSKTSFLLERYIFFTFQEIEIYHQQHLHNTSIVARAKLYIDRHLCSKLTVSKVAKYLSISPDYLCRSFKKAYRITPSNYILRERINQSKVFLEHTSLSTQQIAEHFFYFDNKHFSHMFSKETGISPSEYRKRFHK